MKILSHGSNAGQITVSGELNRLARNISFGHGILAGIQWRQDTNVSIQRGEALAISVLRAKTHFTRFDGSICIISNE